MSEMGRDQEVDREEYGMMTSNIGKRQLVLEKREIDDSRELAEGYFHQWRYTA